MTFGMLRTASCLAALNLCLVTGTQAQETSDEDENVKKAAEAVVEIVVSDDDSGSSLDVSAGDQETKKKIQRVIRRVQSKSSSSKDGKKPHSIEMRVETHKSGDKEKVEGEIRFKGSDGKVHRIDLGKAGAGKILMMDGDGVKMEKLDLDFGKRFRVRATGDSVPGYRVGLECDAASDALKSHLHLDDGGLLIGSVLDDSPASKAGLKKHDIITKVNGESVGELKQLVEAIAESKGSELEFQLVREGEETSVKVTPEKREVADNDKATNMIMEWLGDDGAKLKGVMPEGLDIENIVIESVKPGVILGDKNHKIDVKVLRDLSEMRGGAGKAMKVFRAIVDEGDGEKKLGKVLMNRRVRVIEDKDADHDADEEDDDDQDVDELRERVDDLAKEIKRLRQALRKMQSDRD